MSAQHDTAVGGRVRTSRGLKTQARLLEAGRAVFMEKGYHAARVDDVAAAAEISHGTFYLYFASKEALFERLVADVAAEMAELAAEAPTSVVGDDGRARLREWVDRMAQLYERSGSVLATWTEAELSGQPIGHLGNDVIGGLAAVLATQSRLPKRTGLDPAIASLAVIAMTERLLYHTATKQLRVRRSDLVDLICDVIVDGLLA
mgnify:CR=1 FL=1